MPGFPVHHQLLELAPTHVHQVTKCHPTISCSVVPFSSCPQSFPTSESFPMSQLFASGGQSIKASASSIIPSNEYSGLICFRTDWFDLLSQESSPTPQFKSISSSVLSLLYGPPLTPIRSSFPSRVFIPFLFVGIF